MELQANKRILFNAVSAAVQVVVVGAVYFFLYKYLLQVLGPAQLGVWALVISTSSIANFANFGITSGLVKFIADYRENQSATEMHRLIFTAFVSIVMLFGVLIIIGYLCAGFILSKVIGPQYIGLALKLLPYSLLCLFINEMGGIYTSILEGFQRNYLRNIIFICAAIVFLVLSYVLVPRYGLMGVTYAQVIQSLVILIAGFFTGSSLISGFSVFRWGWDRAIFKKLISYGSKFQLVSILQMLYEPATKMLLTRFGGMASVGYYEMASRLVNQIRALIVNANQVMIPVVAQASHKGMDEVKRLYSRTMSITLFVNAPLICAVISFSAFISLFWIGHVEPGFIFPLIVLSITMFFNVMCGPAYYSALGRGKLNLLVYVHTFMAVLNIALGLILGHFFAAAGVIISWGVTLALGSLLLIIFYQRDLTMRFGSIFSRTDMLLLAIAVLYACIAIAITRYFTYTALTFTIAVVLFAGIFVPLMLFNDNLKVLLKRNARV